MSLPTTTFLLPVIGLRLALKATVAAPEPWKRLPMTVVPDPKSTTPRHAFPWQVTVLLATTASSVSTPMPKNWRTRLLGAHFRLLMSVFAPAARIRERGNAEPRLYWLTRAALVRNLNKLKVES